MTKSEAIDCGIIVEGEYGKFKYEGMCKECKHSQQYSYPATSNMCMNKESEWCGAYHVNHNLMRYVNGCSSFEK